ncbi:MAG: hypothetical protein IPP71_04520 [Bacteroidetes bacterium]|nr:hypothetical protein [Bacteroidota bacterium]
MKSEMGDQLNREPHLRMQSEFRDSRILAGNIDYTYNFYNIRSKLELYSGGQSTIREHYTGAFDQMDMVQQKIKQLLPEYNSVIPC